MGDGKACWERCYFRLAQRCQLSINGRWWAD